MKRWILIVMGAMLACGCRDVPVVEVESNRGDTLKENMINANRYIAQGEEAQIDAYVQRRGWEIKRLAGGARVMVTADKPGAKTFDYEDVAELKYSIETIGGEIIYSNMCDTVIVGRLQPVRGIDAALRTLRPGVSALVILPSEQGYGVIGDGDRIGSRMILVYRIQTRLLENKKTK